MGFAYVTWADGSWSTQLLRAGWYGHRRAAGWRVPDANEDLELDNEFKAAADDEGDENDDEENDGHHSDSSGGWGDDGSDD